MCCSKHTCTVLEVLIGAARNSLSSLTTEPSAHDFHASRLRRPRLTCNGWQGCMGHQPRPFVEAHPTARHLVVRALQVAFSIKAPQGKPFTPQQVFVAFRSKAGAATALLAAKASKGSASDYAATATPDSIVKLIGAQASDAAYLATRNGKQIRLRRTACL